VHYGGLAPGNYRFLVRAVNSDGQVSTQEAEVDFRVIPPLWRRAWFDAVIVAAIIAAGLWAHRARVRHLVAIERVRTGIATDLHDEIGSSLSQIAVLSEVVRQRGARDDATEPLERIGGLSRELLDSIGDIVWAIQPHKDHLSDLKQRMRRFASDVLSASNVELHWVTATGREPDLDLESGMRREVYLIFKEAIRNVARHSRATEAHISLGVADGHLCMEVSDNGRGIESCGEHPGNGVGNMKLRALRLKGELEVRSEDGQGTTLRLRAPLVRRDAYLNRW
jgi:signal transduction histidine kinase